MNLELDTRRILQTWLEACVNVISQFMVLKEKIFPAICWCTDLVALREKQLKIDRQNDPSRHLLRTIGDAGSPSECNFHHGNQIAIAYENDDMERVFQLEYNFDHLHVTWMV